MANALTAIRLLLVLPIGVLTASAGSGAAPLAAVVLIVAIVTDLLDGPIARRTGTATPLGGTFDHTTDCLFVVSGLTGAVVRGGVPMILPVLVAAAFAQYVIDSYWLHRHHGLRGSRLGRYNGICYWAPIGGDTLVRLGLPLRPAVSLVCWLLVLSTCISMTQRLIMSSRQLRQRALSSSDAETTAQSPR